MRTTATSICGLQPEAVDPDEPSVTVWHLQDEAYVEVARVVGQEQVDLDTPYPVTIRPAALVD